MKTLRLLVSRETTDRNSYTSQLTSEYWVSSSHSLSSWMPYVKNDHVTKQRYHVTKQRRTSPPLFLSFLIKAWSRSPLLADKLVGYVIIYQDNRTFVTQSHCTLLAVDYVQKSQVFSTGPVLKPTDYTPLNLPGGAKSKYCFVGKRNVWGRLRRQCQATSTGNY